HRDGSSEAAGRRSARDVRGLHDGVRLPQAQAEQDRAPHVSAAPAGQRKLRHRRRPLKVLLNFHLGTDIRMSVPESMLATLRQRFPGHEFVGADDEEPLAAHAVDAEVFYGWAFPPALVPVATRLRWVQTATAGIENDLTPELGARRVKVTNGAGIAAGVIA